MNEKFDKFKSGVINSMGFIIVAMVIGVYIAKNFVDIAQSGKSPLEIIADGIFALVFGYSVKVVLGYQGVFSGLNSSRMLDTLVAHNEAISAVDKYLPLLPSFCEKENANLRIRKRRAILSTQHLKYEEVFTDDPTLLQEAIQKQMETLKIEGQIIDDGSLKYKWLKFKSKISQKRLKKRIMRCVRKANKVSFVELTPYELTTDGGDRNNPYKFATNPGIHMSKRAPLMLPFSILVAVLFGYFAFKLITDPNWATIIAAIVQTGTFILMGGLQFLKEYLYTVDRFRKTILRKIDILNTFKQEAEANGGQQFAIPEEIIHSKGVQYELERPIEA